MNRLLLRPSLTVLRILIVAGALASIREPRQAADRFELSLVGFNELNRVSVSEHTLIRLALTAVTLSLL